jgi:HK97 family phage portal protein
MGRVREVLRALFGEKAKASQSAGGLLRGVAAYGTAPRRGTRELFFAYRHLPRLRAVSHRIASDIASTPWRLYASAGKRAKGYGRGIIRTKALEDARRSGELREVEAHPFLDLLSTMNPALGGEASMLVTQLYQDLKGEGFWVLERNGARLPIEAWPVPPHWIVETPSTGRPFFRASFLGWQKEFPEADVLWMKSPDPDNPYNRGTGIAESLADELDIDEFAAKHLRNWFFNGGRPSALVGLEGIGEEELERAREQWLARYSGPGKEGQLHFTNAKVTVEDISKTFDEMQIVELRKQEADTIREVFGVPPEVLGVIENSNRATIEASYYLYAMGVLVPRLDFLVGALTPLLREYDERLVLGYVSPVPEDREFRRTIFQASPPGTFDANEWRMLGDMPPAEEVSDDEQKGELFQYHFTFGIITINEARARLGLPPIAGGDKPPDNPLAGGFGGQEMRADPPWTKGVAKQQRTDNVLEALRPERLTDETGPVWQQQVKRWGDKVLGELGLSGSFDMRNPLVRGVLESAAKKVTGVTETTRDALRATLTEGAFAGEGISELRQRVQHVFEVASSSRAETIARTEVVGSSNKANLAAYELSGVVDGKEWLAVRDGNTRPEHRDLDGQRVWLHARFVASSGDSAEHPGGFADPAMSINCRCAVLPVIEDPKAASGLVTRDMDEEAKTLAWKAYDAGIRPWEAEAAEALRRGFAKQEADVLSALEKFF